MLAGGIPFVVGFVGIVGYALFRALESRRGKRFFEERRKGLDAFSAGLYRLAVFGEIPASYRTNFKQALHKVTHTIVVFLVGVLRAVERPLARWSYRLRTARAKEKEGEQPAPSPFLKNIAKVQKKNSEKTSTEVES